MWAPKGYTVAPVTQSVRKLVVKDECVRREEREILRAVVVESAVVAGAGCVRAETVALRALLALRTYEALRAYRATFANGAAFALRAFGTFGTRNATGALDTRDFNPEHTAEKMIFTGHESPPDRSRSVLRQFDSANRPRSSR